MQSPECFAFSTFHKMFSRNPIWKWALWDVTEGTVTSRRLVIAACKAAPVKAVFDTSHTAEPDFFTSLFQDAKCPISPLLPHASQHSGHICSHIEQTKRHWLHFQTPVHASVAAVNFLTSQRNKHHDSRKAEETPVSICRLTLTALFFFFFTEPMTSLFHFGFKGTLVKLLSHETFDFTLTISLSIVL